MYSTHPREHPATDYGKKFHEELERRELLLGEVPVWMVNYKRSFDVCLKDTWLAHYEKEYLS